MMGNSVRDVIYNIFVLQRDEDEHVNGSKDSEF